MDTTEKSLAILYRYIPPERVLRRIYGQVQTPFGAAPREGMETFLSYAESMLHGYSEDEQILAFKQMERLTEQTAELWSIRKSVFVPLVDYGEKTLRLQGDEPLCRFSRVLPWREMYHLLGQDLIVCAYLACVDYRSQTRRRNFVWPAVLRTDQNRLKQLLESGVAENHYHLGGSAHTFPLAWCGLMNDPQAVAALPGNFSLFLQPLTVRNTADNAQSQKERVLLAALIRSILFRALRRNVFPHQLEEEERQPRDKKQSGQQKPPEGAWKPFSSLLEFQKTYASPLAVQQSLSDTIRLLRSCYGARIPQPDGTAACLDYALDAALFRESADSPFRSLAGERRFLYDCFSACFYRTFSGFEEDLLYVYLLLKTSFRAEMVQSNGQTGFRNFQRYQDRKGLGWQGAYQWEAYRMALNAPLSTQNITSLEVRMTPAQTPEDIRDMIGECDQAKRFGDRPQDPGFTAGGTEGWDGTELEKDLHAKNFLKEPLFYVINFVKWPDEEVDQTAENPNAMSLPRCRHNSLRLDIRKRALALAEALSQSPYLCCRIRGIDGCSNEVTCRPEVFGTAFRFLRNFRPEDFITSPRLSAAPVPRLSVTYHAGEDFYDIADGLRAIDEAVNFLDYRRGDRLGHALALGVDPDVHYRKKSMCSILPKQNYLDNLVWLIYRGRELGVRIDLQQYGTMQQQAFQLLRDIYKNVFLNGPVTLQDYYSSMMLRGDMPELYASERFDSSILCQNPYYAWGILRDRRHKNQLESYRKDADIARLYWAYHYDWFVKKEGAKTISVDITPSYITMVRSVQDAMQWHLERRGIAVECNPTSNVLIGTFGDYSLHPVMRFNNEGLELSEGSRRQSRPQMHVCINTDDQGVFDTSLEFEYALLMGALCEQTGVDGLPRYSTNDILAYLRNLQAMGYQAVFPPL